MWQMGGVEGAHRAVPTGRHTAAGTSNEVIEGVSAITTVVRNGEGDGLARDAQQRGTRRSLAVADPCWTGAYKVVVIRTPA
jgi:hypothetical protein